MINGKLKTTEYNVNKTTIQMVLLIKITTYIIQTAVFVVIGDVDRWICASIERDLHLVLIPNLLPLSLI